MKWSVSWRHIHSCSLDQIFPFFSGWMGIDTVEFFELVCLLYCWTYTNFSRHDIGFSVKLRIVERLMRRMFE